MFQKPLLNFVNFFAVFALIALVAIQCGPVGAQMVSGPSMLDFDSVFGLHSDQVKYAYEAHLVACSAPGNVLFPREQPTITIQLVSHEDQLISATGTVEVIAYGTHGVSGDVWTPVVYRTKLAAVCSVPVSASIPANGFQNITLTPQLPEAFGGYAVVVDLGTFGRQFVSSLVRTKTVVDQRIQYPSYCTDALPGAMLERLGIHAVRIEAAYVPTTSPDYASNMASLDSKLKEYQRRNIVVLFMIEGNTDPNDQPLGMPRPWLDDSDTMQQTKDDRAWLPSYDSDIQGWVTTIAKTYGWPNGPINAISLWNEPWDGISISGWGADSLRYREIFTRIGEAVDTAREKYGVQILTGGTDSTSNAMDKLFPDGKDTFLKWFDFASIHYQGLDSHATVKAWVNRKSPRGRVRIWDTESWVANTDDRVAAIVASDRAAGYDRAMGTYGGNIGDSNYYDMRQADGTTKSVQTLDAWSTAAAVSAASRFVGERKFKRLLFSDGLPWVFEFDGLPSKNGAANPNDGTVVVVGDLGEELGPFNLPLRTARGEFERKQKAADWAKLAELDQSASSDPAERSALIKDIDTPQVLSHASMTIDAVSSEYNLYDSFGNIVPANDGKIVLPLDGRGFYLRPTGAIGSFNRLMTALKTARISGIEPLEIVVRDMLVPVTQGSSLRVSLTNVLNRREMGTLTTTLTYDHSLANGRYALPTPPSLTVSLNPGETKNLSIPIGKSSADGSNTYSARVHFVDKAGQCADLQEYVHVNQILHRTIVVDGNLNEWNGALPQSATSEGASGPSITEAAWFPFKKFSDSVVGGYSESYLAYDKKYFYFAAKVADSTPDPGMVRFATRDDDNYFYPKVSYQLNPDTLIQQHQTVVTTSSSEVRALQSPKEGGRILAGWEGTIRKFEFLLNLPTTTTHRVSLYFADWDDSGRRVEGVTILDGSDGKVIDQREISNFRLGKYLSYNLSGEVEIVIDSHNWTTPIANALFFDPSTGGATFAGEDDMTQGNWSSKYGADGTDIVGTDSKMPDYAQLFLPTFTEKTPLVWPAGVRRYSYRKNPDLPSGAGHDNIQIAFNVLPVDQKPMYPKVAGTMVGFTRTVDTDYEYSLNKVNSRYGGGTEIWRMAVPGMPHKHFYPRQPKSPYDGPVTGGKLVILRSGNTLTYECALPWSEIPGVKKRLDGGQTIKFTYRVNDNLGTGTMELAQNRSVSKYNDSLHNDWESHWANEVEFGWQK